ncbi:MobA/MobL family protein, partial [Comamonas thiooxydans]|uniref:MobA/MobL family protein n=2 Tax=Comamonas TaxID=283 RepID=UPI0013F480FD
MAIYHLSVKTVSRSAGRSATAAAAYRAGCKITDGRTGEIHDYTRKGGVQSA